MEFHSASRVLLQSGKKPRFERKISLLRHASNRLSALLLVATFFVSPEAFADPPIADAGPDQIVNEQSPVTLDGSNSSDPEDITVTSYSWIQTAGTTVALAGETTANPTFTAPVRLENLGSEDLIFELTVTDSVAETDTDTVTITVNPVNAGPTANAGPDQSVNEAVLVTLDGTGSSDSDGTVDVYAWTQTSGTTVTLSSISVASPTFTSPTLTSAATLVFSLVVTDNEGALSAADTVSITVNPVNAAPTADAGVDQTINEAVLVTLNGTGSSDSDGTVDVYAWTQTVGTTVTLSSTSVASPTFTSPTVTSAETLTFSLIVTDNESATSAADTVNITVNPVNAAPTADAGVDQTVNEEVLVTLNGTGSSDSDGTVDVYAWTQTVGTTVTLSSTSVASPTFTSPTVTSAETLTFSLVVTDNESTASAADTVSITVNPVNTAPTADAGPDQTVDEEVLVTLDGTDSSDSDGTVDTYAWTQTAGTTVTLSDAAAASPTFTAPTLTVAETLTFSLIVTDNESTVSAADTVNITVDPVNTAPTADAGADQTVDEKALVTLDGSASSDSDGTVDVYAWTQTAGTTVTLSDAAAASPTFTAPTLTIAETLTFSLLVTDNESATSAADTVNITVDPVNEAPIANDDSFDVPEGGSPVAGSNVLTNDTDPDESPAVLTAQIVTKPTLDPLFELNSDGTFTYTHDDSETLSDSFVYEACDSDLLCSSATVTLNVDSVNDAPVVESQVLDPWTIDEEAPLTITLADLVVTDVDSDPSTFVLSVQDGTDYTRVDNTITPILDFEGDLTVPVTVSDGEDDSEVFNVVVTVAGVNDIPVITGQVALTTPEDTSLPILLENLTVTDPDNVFPDDFVLSVLDGADYTSSGNTITPAENFNGQLSVPVTVSDGLLSSAEFVLTVDVSAENDDPVLETPIVAPTAVEGSPFSLDIAGNFTDADNDPLTFTANGLPVSGNLTFDGATGVFSGTPRVEDARDNDPYIITVTATDGGLDTIPADGIFELNISALDRANVSLDISVTPDPAMLNDELRWTFTASNSGPQLATNVALNGSIVGGGLTISGPASCTIQAAVGQVNNFNCTLGSLPLNGATSVVLTALTSMPGDVVAFGVAASTDPLPLDPNANDNSKQVAVGVAEAFSNGAVQLLGQSRVRSVAAGDINNDGAADLVVGTAAGQPIQIYLSGGFRDFATAAISLPDTGENVGVVLADFDGNGTLDLAVANAGGRADMVYSNNGTGSLTEMATLGLTFSQDIASGDFNNDGLMDIVVATIQDSPVYLGDGLGGFSLQGTLGPANSQAVAVGKFDGDALDDIVFANTGGDSQVWINSSGAGFTQGSSLPIGDAMSVVVGQFGGDMLPDLVFGRIPSATNDIPANPVLINDGSGVFAAAAPFALLGNSPTLDIDTGDVNSDGLADLVFVNASGVHQIWTATGSGFTLHREQIVDTASAAGVVTELGMTDVGNPGGADLAMGGAIASGLGVFLNDGFGNLGRGDAVVPVLTLLGEASVELPSGSTYVDSGATAADNIDGDLSSAIVVTGTVNPAVVGDYTITYNVSDFAGNRAVSISRSVTVLPAAGTGGGGGGAASLLMLLLLTLTACLAEARTRCKLFYVVNQKQKQ